MTDTRADFAVLGSTPLARLLAGLLAGTHGRRVIWAGDSHAAFRLPRGVDLSVGAITRPESWALLAQTSPETIKLLTRAGGKPAMARLDPIFFADTPTGQQALAFLRSNAAGFGPAIERLPVNQLGKGREGMVLRDAMFLQRDRLEPILDAWLDGMKVTRLPLSRSDIAIATDGSAQIGERQAAQTILADDEAVLAHLPAETLSALFEHQEMTTILTEPTLPMAARIMLQIDAGLSLAQGSHRGVTAIGIGNQDACVSRIGVLLGANRQLRQAGGTHHDSLRSHDGGLVAGRLGTSGPIILGGFGCTGVFLAPALARWIADAAKPEEVAYFADRSADRDQSASSVGEYRPAGRILDAA